MKSVILIFLVFCTTHSFCQSQFGQFWNTRTQKNPAFQAMNTGHYANVYHRAVWPALSSSYSKNSLSYNGYFDKLKGGLGVYFDNNQSPFSTSTAFKLAYNYQFEISSNSKISFGTSVGVLLSEFDNDKAIYGSQFTPPTDGNSFGLDFGVAYTFNKLETGISFRNVLKSNDVAQYLEGKNALIGWPNIPLEKKMDFSFFHKQWLSQELKSIKMKGIWTTQTYI